MPDPVNPQPEIQLPEGVQQEAQPEVPPQPETEPYRFKYRGEERELPKDIVESFAGVLNTTPQGVVNLLQRSREADRIYAEKARLQEERDAYLQELEALRQQRMGYQPPQPQYAPPPQYQQPDGQVDPIAMLQQINRELREWKETSAKEREELVQRLNAQTEIERAQRIEGMAEQFLDERNKGRKSPIGVDDFLAEVEISGGAAPWLPLERAFDRAWRIMTYDEAGPQAEKRVLEELRKPTAKVVIPGAGQSSGSASPQQSSLEKLEAQLGDMKWGEVVPHIPERR